MTNRKKSSLSKMSTNAKKVLSVGQEDDKKLVVQMSKPMWEQLRRLSFELNISMAELCREGIGFVLEKHKKALNANK